MQSRRFAAGSCGSSLQNRVLYNHATEIPLLTRHFSETTMPAREKAAKEDFLFFS
jgi:hypothetical protein